MKRQPCVLALSYDALVLLEKPSGMGYDRITVVNRDTGHVIFCTPTHSIIGWANADMSEFEFLTTIFFAVDGPPDLWCLAGLRIYYDHGDSVLLRCVCAEGGTISPGIYRNPP